MSEQVGHVGHFGRDLRFCCDRFVDILVTKLDILEGLKCLMI